MSQGFLSKLAFGPRGMRWLMNLWPPFRGVGVKVREIAPDFRRARVELRMRLLNRNYVGTHFGGSMFAMTDPFYMVLMMHVLGQRLRGVGQGGQHPLPQAGARHGHGGLRDHAGDGGRSEGAHGRRGEVRADVRAWT